MYRSIARAQPQRCVIVVPNCLLMVFTAEWFE